MAIEGAYVNHLAIVKLVSVQNSAIAYTRRESFSFPSAQSMKVISRELWSARISAVCRVQKYASELSKAFEAGASAKIVSSSEGLVRSLVDFDKAGSCVVDGAGEALPRFAAGIARVATENVFAGTVRKQFGVLTHTSLNWQNCWRMIWPLLKNWLT